MALIKSRVNAQIVRTDTTIHTRLSKMENELYILRNTNDSINKELYFYRSKEDLYIGLFERYSSHTDNIFGLIFVVISLVIPLSGFFAINRIKRNYKLENDDLRKKIKEYNNETLKEKNILDRRISGIYQYISFLLSEKLLNPDGNLKYHSLGISITSLGTFFRTIHNDFARASELDKLIMKDCLISVTSKSKVLLVKNMSSVELKIMNELFQKYFIIDDEFILLKILNTNNPEGVDDLVIELYEYYKAISQGESNQ